MAGLLIKLGAGLTFIVIAALFIKFVILPFFFNDKKKGDNNNEKN